MSSSERDLSQNIINPELSARSKPHIGPEELRMQAQMLRIKASLQVKNISNIWELAQEDLGQYFTQYEPMPYSNVNPEELYEMPRVKIIKTENKVYFGQIEHKKKHGKGIVLYRQGKLYEGDFLFNEKSGFGCEIYGNGNVYVGHFAQNKKHGRGSFFWYSLCESDKQKEIEQYHGDWWGGLPDGTGEHHKLNGDVYTGKFKNGLKHGDGYEIYANGDKYKGQFVNGLPEGYGEYHWTEDESYYKGDFKQGARNGYGIWKNKQEQYKGHFMLDKKHGYGIYDWGNGNVYKGQWMEDYRHGEGVMMLDGEIEYDGFWENGQKSDEKPAINPVTLKSLKDSGVRGDSASKGMDSFGNSRVGTAKPKNSSVDRNSLTAKGKNSTFDRNKSLERTKSARKGEFSRSFQKQQRSAEKSKCGHRNCIPQQTIGKMPKQNWKP